MGKLVVGENDLRTWCLQNDRQNLLDEWDDENNALKPTEITYGSSEKVCWICAQGHKYQQVLHKRTNQNCGCPYCSGRRVLAGYNDLQTWCLQNDYKSLLEEWDDNNNLKPTEVTSGTQKKICWRCSQGHVWKASVASRTYSRAGCPYCSGLKVLTGFNDLRTWCIQNNRKNILDEWDYKENEFKPTEISRASNKVINWICSRGHKYQTMVYRRINQGCGCPYCSGHKVLAGFNDLRTWCISNNREDLLAEWDVSKNADLKPEMITSKTHQKVWWKCKQGHAWKAYVANRTNLTNGCPYCAKRKTLMGHTDLQTKAPFLALEWNYEKNGDLKPTDISANDHLKVWWKCKYGHEWKTSTASRYRRGCGCPKCSANGTSLPEQGIAFYLEKACKIEQRVKIAGKEIDVYLPEYGIGIEYDGMYYHTKKTKDKETNKDMKLSLAGVRLIRIKEADKNYVDDNIIYFDTDRLGKNYDWAICKLCESLVSLTGENSFSSLKVDAQKDMLSIYEKLNRYYEENSLAKQCPSLVKDWHPEKNGTLVPEMFTVGSDIKVWWQCSKGHEWQARIISRTHGGGCPICSRHKVLAGYNDLATEHPELLKDWDVVKNALKPSEVVSGSDRKVWWKCFRCGLEWLDSIYKRSQGGSCPKCSLQNKKHILIVGSLADKYPDIASTWHPEKNGTLSPSDIPCYSSRKVYWLCPLGHEYQETVRLRVGLKVNGNGTGCPYCK